MNMCYDSMARQMGFLGALLLGTSVLGSPALAQQQIPEPISLVGTVVDANTGQPIAGAAVVLIDRAQPVLSDQRGRFSFEEVSTGPTTLIVTQLGYDTLRTEVEVGPDPLTVRMSPDPVVLERATAMVDRFEARRNASGSSVRVFERLGLQTATSFSVLEFLQMRAHLTPVGCPNPLAMSACAYVRGRRTEVQVYLDGARIVGGLDVLASLRPEELYTLEVVAGGRSIRAYTNWYMETVARGRRIPTGYLF